MLNSCVLRPSKKEKKKTAMVTLGNIVYCVSLPENLNALNIRIRVDLQKNNLFCSKLQITRTSISCIRLAKPKMTCNIYSWQKNRKTVPKINCGLKYKLVEMFWKGNLAVTIKYNVHILPLSNSTSWCPP